VKKFIALFALSLAACSNYNDRFVDVVNDSQRKTVMIEVQTVMKQTMLSFDGEKFSVHTETVPVTFVGAGVFISHNGHVLTCAHLFNVGLSTTITVIKYGDSRVPAEVLYKDTGKDLALLKIPVSWFTPKASLSRGRLQVGQEIITIGNPAGLNFSSSHGMISHLNRNIYERYTYTQSDLPTNGGNSGGPVFNLNGELIGLSAMKLSDADGMSFAITPDTIRIFLSTFRGLDE